MDNEWAAADRVRAGAGLPPHRWTKVDDSGSEAVIAAYPTIIAGGGPAGLTAAYELTVLAHNSSGVFGPRFVVVSQADCGSSPVPL
jgi:hypothetical protein